MPEDRQRCIDAGRLAMNGPGSNVTMALIGPSILAVFAIVFICAWLIEKERHYLLLLALACVLFGLAVGSQVLAIPHGVSLNAVASGLLYTAAVVATAEGILRRAQRPLGLRADATAVAVVTVLLWYYAYVTPSLLARVYVQNFGYGTILLIAALRLVPASGARVADCVLFWVLLVFALHFFPRTILTIGAHAPADAKAFGASSFWQVLQLSLAVLGVALAFAVLAATVVDSFDDLRRERDLDPLTGVLNRRGFEERAKPLFAQRSASPLALVLCDLDHFKSINDSYGHSAGDEVLATFGAILRQELHGGVVGRFGGEEFAVLLAGATLEEAARTAEHIRSVVERRSFAAIPASRPVTASFGIAGQARDDRLQDLYERADRRLYLAKFQGRNCVRFSDLAEAPDTGVRLSPSPVSAAVEAWSAAPLG